MGQKRTSTDKINQCFFLPLLVSSKEVIKSIVTMFRAFLSIFEVHALIARFVGHIHTKM